MSKTKHGHGLGWVRDKKDARDFTFAVKAPVKVPARVDLREDPDLGKIPITNQGNLGSCTGQALSAALAFARIKSGDAAEQISALFIYWNERYLEGSINQDNGAQIRTGAKVLNKFGGCSEQLWPYIVRKYRTQPTRDAFVDAAANATTEYRKVADLNDMRVALASGFPVVFGFTVYEGFENDTVSKTGMAAMPKRGERVLGGHAVLAVGYDDEKQVVIVRNSWGETWGDKGFFYLPYGYFQSAKLSSDYWVIQHCK